MSDVRLRFNPVDWVDSWFSKEGWEKIGIAWTNNYTEVYFTEENGYKPFAVCPFVSR